VNVANGGANKSWMREVENRQKSLSLLQCSLIIAPVYISRAGI